ncbi:glycoside hydrolase family 26 protein [Actinocorallia populi]|uniref:glycoside hydrolase family 26 protein n=1 Tax=Actinocorallia populi TaxID=2079200 RepID=UPI000D08665D|nr:glycosyl hydrolase [Actinocorallia populi]
MTLSRGLRVAAFTLAGALALAACGDPALDRDAYHAAEKVGELKAVDPVDIRKLIHPENEYLGLAYDNTIDSGIERMNEFGEKVGKPHNLLKYFEEVGSDFKEKENKRVWEAGALPFADVEPMEGTLKDYIDGKYDDDIRSYAIEVKESNIPLAYSWGHEMNGWWYPWGFCSRGGTHINAGKPNEKPRDEEDIGIACQGESKENTAEDFAAAWRHIHDIFTEVGAGNVIWVWSPNTAQSPGMPAMKDFYPGDEYVDWIGISGYMNEPNPPTKKDSKIFQNVFGDLLRDLRSFTKKPVVIAETGSTATLRKADDVVNLFAGILFEKKTLPFLRKGDIVGFVWFDVKKEEFGEVVDFRVESQPAALKKYKQILQTPKYGNHLGFDPKQLIDDN